MSNRKEVSEVLNRRVFLSSAAVGGVAAASGAAAAPGDRAAPVDRSLQWMYITSGRLPQIIKDVQGVCIVPWGCLERHGPHLPLGTDTIEAEAACARAAQIEPAVVFPAVYYGQIAEARHCSGTISLDHDLLLRLWRATLDEIGRNGFTKIIIVNHHGGNTALLEYLSMSLRQERRPYVAYAAQVELLDEDRQRWAEMSPRRDGHAGLQETSSMLHVCADSVHLEDLHDLSDGEPRGRLKHLGPTTNSFSWYANFPTHFGGNPQGASAEKGAFWLESVAKHIARQIKAVKQDEVSAVLAKEFYDAAERAGLPAKTVR